MMSLFARLMRFLASLDMTPRVQLRKRMHEKALAEVKKWRVTRRQCSCGWLVLGDDETVCGNCGYSENELKKWEKVKR
jgi:hypothetical protein